MSNNKTTKPTNINNTANIKKTKTKVLVDSKNKTIEKSEVSKNIKKNPNYIKPAKSHGFRTPPKNTFFAGDIKRSFVVIPVRKRPLSWLFKSPLNSVSTEVIFRFFKKNINIINHNISLSIKYENYCNTFKERYGNDENFPYKDFALRCTIDDLIIGALRNKKRVSASLLKIPKKEKKDLKNTIMYLDGSYYRCLSSMSTGNPFIFYEIEFIKACKRYKELFFGINLDILTTLSSDPTKKWSTRIDLFDDIRVVKSMPTNYFPYNSRVGLIDFASGNPHLKTITLSKSVQILEIMKCKKEIPEWSHKNNDYTIDNRCYAVCLKKQR